MGVVSTGPSGYRVVMRAAANAADIYVYGPIGADWFGEGVSAKQFSDDLKKLGAVKTINLRINSEGGSVFDGRTMHTLLADHKARKVVHVDGLAASAASFLAMAGDEIVIAKGAFMMIHNSSIVTFGGADDLRRTADLLDSVNGTIRETYAARTKAPLDKIKDWMDAETWFTGAEAVAAGFADRLTEDMKVAASVRRPDQFRNLPVALRPNRAKALRIIRGD